MEDQLKVTSLIENCESPEHPELQAEFGLSLHVEHQGTRILFDTGSTGAFTENARDLGIDLEDVDLAVLSHHHFDHGGGLERFFELNDRARVHLRDGPRVDRYFRFLGVIKRPIGIDLDVLDRFAHRIEYVEGMRTIAPHVHLLTAVGSAYPRPRGNRLLFMDSAGALVPDPFDHELLMVVQEDDGLVVFSGCSHRGILNLVDAARAQFPDVPVKAVFGGFHLIGLPFFNSMAASRSEVRAIGRTVMEKVDGTIYSGHCTGNKAFSVLAGVMGDRLSAIRTGTTVEI